jgi:hypothetical protein
VELGAGASQAAAAPAAAPVAAAPAKSAAPDLTSAAAPAAPAAVHTPVAASGAQSPSTTHAADPHARIPRIAFRFGKRDPPAVAAAAAPAAKAAAPVEVQYGAGTFTEANDAAIAAYDALPARYKKKPMKEALLTMIELGGAANYESKKKPRSA